MPTLPFCFQDKNNVRRDYLIARGAMTVASLWLNDSCTTLNNLPFFTVLRGIPGPKWPCQGASPAGRCSPPAVSLPRCFFLRIRPRGRRMHGCRDHRPQGRKGARQCRRGASLYRATGKSLTKRTISRNRSREVAHELSASLLHFQRSAISFSTSCRANPSLGFNEVPLRHQLMLPSLPPAPRRSRAVAHPQRLRSRRRASW